VEPDIKVTKQLRKKWENAIESFATFHKAEDIGVVKKGKETIFTARFDKEGIYRLICLTHGDIEHNGPMIAYIVVD
jgi:plastocyanin